MKDPEEIVSEIKYESENFSLAAMYAQAPIYPMCDWAAVIITENQLYAAYLESKRKTKTPHGHGPTFSKMQFLFYALDEILKKYNEGEELKKSKLCLHRVFYRHMFKYRTSQKNQ